MSAAWEISDQDIAGILGSNNILHDYLLKCNIHRDDTMVLAEHVLSELTDFDKLLVEEAALCYDDLEEQADFAKDTLRKVLAGRGVIWYDNSNADAVWYLQSRILSLENRLKDAQGLTN